MIVHENNLFHIQSAAANAILSTHSSIAYQTVIPAGSGLLKKYRREIKD
jgi:hypothetical protein